MTPQLTSYFLTVPLALPAITTLKYFLESGKSKYVHLETMKFSFVYDSFSAWYIYLYMYIGDKAMDKIENGKEAFAGKLGLVKEYVAEAGSYTDIYIDNSEFALCQNEFALNSQASRLLKETR